MINTKILIRFFSSFVFLVLFLLSFFVLGAVHNLVIGVQEYGVLSLFSASRGFGDLVFYTWGLVSFFVCLVFSERVFLYILRRIERLRF